MTYPRVEADVQVLTCARVESIQLDPYEGGSTRMRGGIPAVCCQNSKSYLA